MAIAVDMGRKATKNIITGLSTRLAWYVIFDVKKEKPPFFSYFFGFGVLLPPDPLVKCECIFFHTNVRIWIDLGENMAQNLCCCFIIQKIVDFYVDNNILWNTQNAPDSTIFIIFFWGSMPTDPAPSTSVNQHHKQANYHPGM